MKNTIYAVVIAICILGAVVVFMHRRSAGNGGINSLSDSKMLWVKCTKCNQSYEMSEKQYYHDVQEKAKANTSPMPITMPLTCEKCGKDGIRRAIKCEQCGEVFFANTVPADFEDRCPKCKHSAIEAGRNARKAGASQ
jgi:phage FluMu protein Com